MITHRKPDAAERAAQLRDESRQDQRWVRRRLSTYVLGCLGSCAIGLALMGAGMHSTDPHTGPQLFWLGLLLGDVGIFVSIWHWFRSTST